MKYKYILLLTSILMVSCQNHSPNQDLAQKNNINQNISSFSNTKVKPLALSQALKSELRVPDEEAEPNNNTFSEDIVNKTVGAEHTKGHQFYYEFLDQGESSLEAILKHDGHLKSASLVRHWRKVLAENSFWPDTQSTTYNGPWPALEHGELTHRGNGWFWFDSNSTKANEYYQRAFKAWRKDLPADHPGQKEAWEWLGRSTHFIQDITVPFHTKSLLRPAQWVFHNAYEKAAAEQFGKYLPSKNYNPKGVWENGPYPNSPANWGIYFPQRTGAGDMIRYGATQSEPFYRLVNERENKTSGNWEKTRAVLVPMGAKLTVGMIQAFLTDVKAVK